MPHRYRLPALWLFFWGFHAVAHAVDPAADSGWIDQSNRHAQALLEADARYGPEGVASLGLEQYDTGIIDLKPRNSERAEADLAAVAATLEAARGAESDERVKQDLAILVQAARDEHDTSVLNRRLMIPYFDLGRMLFGSFNAQLDPRVSKQRHAAALVRLRRYAGNERGYEPITTLARARIEERMNDASLTWPWVTEVEQHLADAKGYVDGTRELLQKSGLKGWQKDFDVLASQLKAHNDWVRTTVLPKARKSNRLPPEIYANNLKSYGVDADPHQLMQRAQFAFMQTRDEMDALARSIAAQKGSGPSDYRSLIRDLKKNQIAPDHLLDTYKGRLTQVEDIIRREHIVTLPKRDAMIRLGTEAESAASPAPYMNPPRLIGNTGEPAIFVLVTGSRNPKGGVFDDFGYDAISWALTTHEARPGHELQFSGMIEHGVTTARAVYAFNSANVEGWGLYSEAIMKQYLPPEGQLGALQLRLMRTARAFLDPMLNLGLIEPAAARRILTEQVMLSEAFAKSEVDRYTFGSPGQATAYFYGYSRLEALRARTELALGDKFDQQHFHDFIIGEGLLPLDLLDQAVATRFVPTQH